jgi:hypothetical protein
VRVCSEQGLETKTTLLSGVGWLFTCAFSGLETPGPAAYEACVAYEAWNRWAEFSQAPHDKEQPGTATSTSWASQGVESLGRVTGHRNAEAARDARVHEKRVAASEVRARSLSRSQMRQQVVDNVLQEQQARAADLRRQKAAVAEAKDGLRRKNLETGKQMRMDLTEKQKQAELERQSYSERGRELVEAEKAWQSFRREKYSPQSTPCPSPREPSTAIRP